ncbi:MAG TPA: Asp-tRNA(Asn)/Glu-tRNA(Gln) amidotransferase subunit GatB [Candidatus Saccharimonadales bacterium]|nr:Asp-tRNA(Asn)/Glu-tRNA(Gln) amidotransferase subunit GatB [Candidatus Saccharimonadales bacterium]
MSKYEVVIGIETHVQLATKSKLFCGCNNDSRTAEPNTNVCPVCLGFPGALPVLNAAAVELALRAGHALNAYDQAKQFHTKFDRKNYFYPDSPMNYQITQFDEPIIGGGYVEFPLAGATKRVGVTRAHLEADAGKLIHPVGTDYSLVDLNRAGTPLLEIVSEPDMRSAAEAKTYAQELYNLMRYARVSDADLYYGNMRFDVNVSLRPAGTKEFGTRTESKNLNSFRAVAGVVEYETKRQADLLDRGETIRQETRGWDEAKQKTVSQRGKEEAHDYRYFPEPDLPPLVITEKKLQEAKKSITELPNDIRAELAKAKIPAREAEALIANPSAATMWLQVAIENPEHSRFALNWLIGDRVRLEEEQKQSLAESSISAASLSGVGQLIADGKLSSTNAKLLLSYLWKDTVDPVAGAEKLELLQNSDSSTLEKIVDEVIAAHPQPVADYRAGEAKVLGFLVGQVMKASKGQANPPMVNAILKRKLEA